MNLHELPLLVFGTPLSEFRWIRQITIKVCYKTTEPFPQLKPIVFQLISHFRLQPVSFTPFLRRGERSFQPPALSMWVVLTGA